MQTWMNDGVVRYVDTMAPGNRINIGLIVHPLSTASEHAMQ